MTDQDRIKQAHVDIRVVLQKIEGCKDRFDLFQNCLTFTEGMLKLTLETLIPTPKEKDEENQDRT